MIICITKILRLPDPRLLRGWQVRNDDAEKLTQ